MKRLIGFLVGLYPKDWRERYGEELRTLIEDSSPQSSTVLDLLKGAFVMRVTSGPFVKQALIFSIGGMIIAGGASYLIPPKYESVAVMKARGGDPVELIQKGMARTTSRQSLTAIILDRHLNLYEHQRATDPLEQIEDRMRADTRVAIQSPKTNRTNERVFMIQFRYTDPRKAHDTVQAMVTRLIDSAAALGAEFLIVDPPKVGQAAIYPNRPLIAAIGFIAGLILAALFAAGRKIRGADPSPGNLQLSV